MSDVQRFSICCVDGVQRCGEIPGYTEVAAMRMQWVWDADFHHCIGQRSHDLTGGDAIVLVRLVDIEFSLVELERADPPGIHGFDGHALSCVEHPRDVIMNFLNVCVS